MKRYIVIAQIDCRNFTYKIAMELRCWRRWSYSLLLLVRCMRFSQRQGFQTFVHTLITPPTPFYLSSQHRARWCDTQTFWITWKIENIMATFSRSKSGAWYERFALRRVTLTPHVRDISPWSSSWEFHSMGKTARSPGQRRGASKHLRAWVGNRRAAQNWGYKTMVFDRGSTGWMWW